MVGSHNWGVTPATTRLLQHWRYHDFQGIRPFFCQIEAVETIIWLTEVARKHNSYKKFWDHIVGANEQANPEIIRIAMKMATGAGKTTVMAMLIAWQTVNAVRSPASNLYTRGFLVVAPGITIRDRLRVLKPNDPDSYYKSRELVPSDMLNDTLISSRALSQLHPDSIGIMWLLNSPGSNPMKHLLPYLQDDQKAADYLRQLRWPDGVMCA